MLLLRSSDPFGKAIEICGAKIMIILLFYAPSRFILSYFTVGKAFL